MPKTAKTEICEECGDPIVHGIHSVKYGNRLLCDLCYEEIIGNELGGRNDTTEKLVRSRQKWVE